MGTDGIEFKNLRAQQKRYFAKKRAMAREAAGALGRAVTVLETQIKKRVKPARRINKQDTTDRKARSLDSRSPVRTSINNAKREGKVTLTRHFTGARSKAVTALFRRFGEESALFRKGLLVGRTRKRGKGQKKGLRKLAGPGEQYILFSRNEGKPKDKGIAKWATRKDRGEQLRRHVVRLQKPEIIQALSILPGVAGARTAVTNILRAAGRKAILS